MSPVAQSVQPRRIGAHLSTAGGVDQAVIRAHQIGANCLQIFSGSPRMWQRTPLAKIDPKKVWAEQEKYGVTPIFTHALYLVNLASDKPELRQLSAKSLQHDLAFDSHIKGSGVVVHLGSHQGRGFAIGQAELVSQIKAILAATPTDSTFLIENSAGQNGKIASDLDEIRWLLDQVNSPRLGWCFDTCHGFAAGYNLGQVGQKLTELKLWSTLKVIHVNDSKDPFDSGRDRHANIGDGLIPQADLKAFLRLPEAAQIPIITEVPGLDGNGPDAENIHRLQSLVQ